MTTSQDPSPDVPEPEAPQETAAAVGPPPPRDDQDDEEQDDVEKYADAELEYQIPAEPAPRDRD